MKSTFSRGFTLVELMVSMTIASGLMLAVSQFVGNMGQDAGNSERKFTRTLNIQSALDLLKWDISQAGTGVSKDLFGSSLVNLVNGVQKRQQIQDVLSTVIRDINLPAPSDQLLLGGSGIPISPPAAKSYIIDDYDRPTGTIIVPRPDAPGITLTNPFDPVNTGINFLEPSPGDLIMLTDMSGRNCSVNPVPVVDIPARPLNDPYIHVQINDADLTRCQPLAPDISPVAGFLMTAYQPIEAFIPEALPQAHWFVDANNSLIRRLVANPINAPLAVVDHQILNEVLDFQVAFLVWRCGAPTATWVNNLLDNINSTGEFAAGGLYGATVYGPGVQQDANRYLSLQQRLISVRVSFVVREQRSATSERGTAFRTTTGNNITLEDSTVAVAAADRQRFDYYHVEQTFDPANIRIKSKNSILEVLPAVRSVSTDEDLKDPAGSGECIAKKDLSDICGLVAGAGSGC